MKTTADNFREIIQAALDEDGDPVEYLRDFLEDQDSHFQRSQIEGMVLRHIPNGVKVRHVEVQSLPESYFKERLDLIAKAPTSKVWVVAKDGMIGDWACYIGFPDEMSEYGITQDPSGWYRYQLTNWLGVLRNGDKVDEATARALFPEHVGAYRS